MAKFFSDVAFSFLEDSQKRILELKEKYDTNFSRNILNFLEDNFLLSSQLIPLQDLDFFCSLYLNQLSELEKLFEREHEDAIGRDKQDLLFKLIREAQDKSLRDKLQLALHGERTGLYAESLALALNVNPRLARLSGRYHDIGKLRVPSDVLLKPGKLTQEEWEYVFEHPIWSERILDPVYSKGERILKAVRSHHEDWDGGGYPDGKEGRSIPPLARILRVADSFDSMTSERPYDRKKSFEESVEEIEDNENGDYDPDVTKKVWRLRQIYDLFHSAA